MEAPFLYVRVPKAVSQVLLAVPSVAFVWAVQEEAAEVEAKEVSFLVQQTVHVVLASHSLAYLAVVEEEELALVVILLELDEAVHLLVT